MDLFDLLYGRIPWVDHGCEVHAVAPDEVYVIRILPLFNYSEWIEH